MTDTTDILERFDDEFPASCFISIDNGWREVDGERVGGFTVRVVAPGRTTETTVGTMAEALAVALEALK